VIYDCVVVGAGPAGSSAAYQLASRGFSVLLLEKEKLPRYKPCGGLVISRVTEWLDIDFTPAISVKVSRMRCCNEKPWGSNGDFELPRPVWMVHRAVFDHFLARHAVGRGAELWQEFPVTDVIAVSDRWRVISADRAVEARYLIAADGAKGMLSRRLGFTARLHQVAGALEAEIPDERSPEPVMHLRITNQLTGYAWNFAKADSHSIGIGTWKKDRPSLRAELEKYCASFGLAISQGRLCGHPLLLWAGVQRVHTERALLAGEAACMVDPFNGEGIRFAMISGVMAAESIARALHGDTGALENYSERLQREIGREMSLAGAMARRFYAPAGDHSAPRGQNPLYAELFSRLVCGDISYQKFFMASAFLNVLNPLRWEPANPYLTL